MATEGDYIRKVALVGGSGQIGSYILKYLIATGKHSVTVLTRSESTATIPPSPNLTVLKTDFTSQTDLISALTNHDFLIITLSPRAPENLHAEIVTAAKIAGVKWVMPNYFGYGLDSDGRGGNLAQDALVGSFKKYIADVSRHEDVHWTALCCGFWYEFSLGMGPNWLGFDIPGRKVVMYGDGERRINTSTWEACGRGVAALLSLPVRSQGEDGEEGGKAGDGDGGNVKKGLTLTDFDKRGVYISSFLISQRDMLNSLHRVLGTSDADWTITYEDPVKRYEDGMKELQGGDMLGFAKALYARLFFESGEGDYESKGGLDNEKLGLPGEDLDEATKRAVEMVEGGFGLTGLKK